MNEKRITTRLIFLISGISAMILSTLYLINRPPSRVYIKQQLPIIQASQNNQQTAGYPDLIYAAEKAVIGIVHVKATIKSGYDYSSGNPLYDFLFGYSNKVPRYTEGAGSGIIISDNGYIVTNNHVIDDATELKVVLENKKEYKAEVIGKDIHTDLALLKIEAEGLGKLQFGSSDDLRLGEWVLAIGNPFGLTSTVTAGIVSAKARGLPLINNSRLSISSFIQTDAAVNPGNSGGALVNTKGEVVGINTAIISPSGGYTGYSFAIPSSIAQKVIGDLMQYGSVQRAVLGIQIADLNTINREGETLAKVYDIDLTEGVLVLGIENASVAQKAGMREKDVLIAIDSTIVSRVSELQEAIALHSPGEIVRVKVNRKGTIKTFNIELVDAKKLSE